jgi:RNA polymerase sigma-54 factor
LRTLDPRPGQAFDFEPIQPVQPDLYLTVAKDADTGEEGWFIELNTDALPKVLVDRHYHATLMKGARAKPDRDFVAERFQSANWLVKTLEQRATTILKVAREIVRQQDAFFRKGVSALKPLVLRDIAIATGLHESTVSRVTSNKYIATPRGIFELKYFFTSALPGRAPGAVVSSESVRSRIRHLVDGEGSSQPLSDDRIVDLLKGEGVDIARRTVAKYREAMRIPSSAERRRLGRLGMGRSLSSSVPAGVPSAAVAAQALSGPAD